MSCTLRGTIRYDGTDFAGWQRQPGQRTIQGELEAALAQIASEPVDVQGAGRTDAGVHALGQVFSCRWPRPFPPRLRHALSKMLGPEIRVLELMEAPDNFSARFDARSKRYVYTMDLGKEPDPFGARYAWHVPYRLDLDLMEELLPKIRGQHDFAGFQSAGTQMESTQRTLYSVTLHQGGLVAPLDGNSFWRLEFHGDAFLYKMVRNLTGTLEEIGRKRFPPKFLEEQLASGGPFRGHCAPAHGLALASVFYEAPNTQ
ncbi:MAG: tRNA pseudouridine(38-40) synthase TruA [Candidatus Hydrogenedentes bacterium]|nr:tRNA pseudouridine(38-40) synthase TruA [Candidatus Hydrogenedentota bacterium]